MIKILLKCITITLCVLTLFVITAFISVTSKKGSAEKEELSQTGAAMYTLCEYGGKIALYKHGYAMPVEIYDIYVDSLPESERAKIEAGIDADSDSQILKLIEAYTS